MIPGHESESYGSFQMYKSLEGGHIVMPPELREEIIGLILAVCYHDEGYWDTRSPFLLLNIILDIAKDYVKQYAEQGNKEQFEHWQAVWIAIVQVKLQIKTLLLSDELPPS